VARHVKLPPGYYIEWSGQYENQIRAKRRLEIVIPVVFLIIFVLLYKTYNSAKEVTRQSPSSEAPCAVCGVRSWDPVARVVGIAQCQ